MRRRSIIIILSVVLAITVLVSVAFIFYRNRAVDVKADDTTLQGVRVSSEKITDSPYELKGGTGSSDTDVAGHENLTVHTYNERPYDGNAGCYIQDKDTKQIYAERYLTSGYNAEMRSNSGYIYYQNDHLTRDAALAIIDNLCPSF